jgi:precorrin-4 C11-methyltransferase
MTAFITAFVKKQPTALLLEIRDEGTDYLEATKPEHVTIISDINEADPKKYELLIIVSPYAYLIPDGLLELHFVPMVGTIGFGLAHHPDDYEDIYDQIDEAFTKFGYLPCSHKYCTIDVKADEPFVDMLEMEYNEDVVFFTVDELAAVEVPNPSKTVKKHVGTPSVCEAAAILGSNHGKLIVPKVKGKNWTAALAIDYKYLREEKGHIEIVGAGPGDPDLVSVRGRKMLEKADLILYAGSLVPKALTECHKSGAVVRSSADMNLEEQCTLMKEHYDKGHFIVRLHTGDPCIFGAIQEQMAFFDEHQMDYHITPGISSFLAAAAELRSQFTIPERTQTIILTRGEGRTPMPEKEQLHLLAKSQSTMCIFLSAAIVDDVQKELLQEYPEDTPVAACYHLTWPDQKIYRGVLKDLAKIVHDNKLTLTTMLVVGEAIDNRQGLSELYSKYFTHLFRKGEEPS